MGMEEEHSDKGGKKHLTLSSSKTALQKYIQAEQAGLSFSNSLRSNNVKMMCQFKM